MRTVVITGANRGIGLELARQLLDPTVPILVQEEARSLLGE